MEVGGSWRAERKIIDLSPSSTPLFYCKSQYPLASAAAPPFPWVQPGFMLLIITSSLILSNSVCLFHAYALVVMQLLPASLVFGGGGKEHEVDVGKNRQKNWFGLVWVF